jgi:hypothetical protein
VPQAPPRALAGQVGARGLAVKQTRYPKLNTQTLAIKRPRSPARAHAPRSHLFHRSAALVPPAMMARFVQHIERAQVEHACFGPDQPFHTNGQASRQCLEFVWFPGSGGTTHADNTDTEQPATIAQRRSLRVSAVSLRSKPPTNQPQFKQHSAQHARTTPTEPIIKQPAKLSIVAQTLDGLPESVLRAGG